MTVDYASPTLWPTASPALVGLLAGATALVATPLARGLARRTSFVDSPSPRKVHAKPTPLLGGVAVVAAVAVALAFAGVSAAFSVWWVATFIAAVGLYDDRFGLPPLVKLAAQVAAAAVVVLVEPGLRIAGPDGSSPASWSSLLSIVWIVAITNAFNLLDNMDGLCAGTAVAVATGLLGLAVIQGQSAVAGAAAAVLGAAIGFLVYNSSPASIFLGDCGSLFLGFVLAVLCTALDFPGWSTPSILTVILVLFAVPTFDTTLVTISRLRRGLDPLRTPGKDHLSHRLAHAGWGPARAVSLLVAISTAAATAAVLAGLIGGAFVGMCGLALVALFTAGIAYWESPVHRARIDHEDLR